MTAKVLAKEFDELFSSPPLALPQTRALVVLSGPENNARIEYAAELWRQMDPNTLFMLHGVDEHLEWMKFHATDVGIPAAKVLARSSGPMATANTLSQFQAMREDSVLREAGAVTLVTSGYHVPRLRRMIGSLPFKVNVRFPYKDWNTYNAWEKVNGEIRRILTYSQKGDINRNPFTECP